MLLIRYIQYTIKAYKFSRLLKREYRQFCVWKAERQAQYPGNTYEFGPSRYAIYPLLGPIEFLKRDAFVQAAKARLADPQFKKIPYRGPNKIDSVRPRNIFEDYYF